MHKKAHEKPPTSIIHSTKVQSFKYILFLIKYAQRSNYHLFIKLSKQETTKYQTTHKIFC